MSARVYGASLKESSSAATVNRLVPSRRERAVPSQGERDAESVISQALPPGCSGG